MRLARLMLLILCSSAFLYNQSCIFRKSSGSTNDIIAAVNPETDDDSITVRSQPHGPKSGPIDSTPSQSPRLLPPVPVGNEVTYAQNTNALIPYDIFEITFRQRKMYRNPVEDARVAVHFTGPGGSGKDAGGFYWGTAGDNDHMWKVRFAPPGVGSYRYSYEFADNEGRIHRGSGSFMCVEGRTGNKGFLRIAPDNRYGFVFDDGTPFFPIGTQSCFTQVNFGGKSSIMASMDMDGPFMPPCVRPDGTKRKWVNCENLLPLPQGPLFVRSPSMNPQNADVRLRALRDAGFNIWRHSADRCAPGFGGPKLEIYDENLSDPLVHLKTASMLDEFLLYLRKYEFRVILGFFGSAFDGRDWLLDLDPYNPEHRSKWQRVENFLEYMINRWGCMVDIWEIINERCFVKTGGGGGGGGGEDDPGRRKCFDRCSGNINYEMYGLIAKYIREKDIYDHPITTSDPLVKKSEAQELLVPHCYGSWDLADVDLIITDFSEGLWKRDGMPVIVGEYSNFGDRTSKTWKGGNWDELSDVRLRLSMWSSFVNQVSLMLWDTSGWRDSWYMNTWVGPMERQYMNAFSSFVNAFLKDAGKDGYSSSEVDVISGNARAYAVRARNSQAVYIVNPRMPNMATGLRIAVEIDTPGSAFWYNTEDGNIIPITGVSRGYNIFDVPAFRHDIALLVTPGSLPDSDRDGIPNHLDDDDDNDGYPDYRDAFPLDPVEQMDIDGDKIGDNMDADIDGDGQEDDLNRNGVADNEELDYDGDGFLRAEAIPWDAFPLDPNEWRDTDGDGIGDNSDEDDDGDGWSDNEELKAGTDPLDRLSFPTR